MARLVLAALASAATWSLGSCLKIHNDVGAIDAEEDAPLVALFNQSGGADLTADQYQAFIDFMPVSRYNNFAAFARNTRTAGHHAFPGINPGQQLPALIRKFDWALAHEFRVKSNSDPRTVFMMPTPDNLAYLKLQSTLFFSRKHKNRVLVLGDDDKWLSEALGGIGRNPYDSTGLNPNAELVPKPAEIAAYQEQRVKTRPKLDATIEHLRKYFGRIFYEAKDVKVDGVMTMPIGLTEFFLRKGVAKTAINAIQAVDVSKKTGWVKGAFSFYHDLARCPRGWGEAQQLRTQARDWAMTEAASKMGVDSKTVEPLQWWGEIAKYRFLMAPTGCGVQTPKQLEALSVLTIPIIRRGPYPAYDDLVSYGFPIVVVDNWDEITPENLEKWWAELSPGLKRFRKTCLNTEGYWKFFTGNGTRCGH